MDNYFTNYTIGFDEPNDFTEHIGVRTNNNEPHATEKDKKSPKIVKIIEQKIEDAIKHAKFMTFKLDCLFNDKASQNKEKGNPESESENIIEILIKKIEYLDRLLEHCVNTLNKII